MKKAQFAGQPITQILFVLVAILIILFGAKQITELGKATKNIEIVNLHNTLANVIKKQSKLSYGSVEEKIIALPPEIQTICFVDRSKNISPLVNCNLNYEINKYEDKNVFFEPFNKFTPIQISDFELNENENPLCLQSVGGTSKLSIASKGNRSLVSTFKESEKKIDCVSVLYNSHPNNSIDIVFLPYGYQKFDDFREDVNKNIQVFLSTEPFNSNKDKMNFYKIDKLDELNCEIGQWVKCDEFEVKKLASYCPNDYIVILIDRNKLKDLLNPIRSSAVSNMEKINTADNKLVILHEFGHIFGGLADEYVDEKYYSNIAFDPNEYPNCDFPPECKEWKGINGTGCFEGCSLKSYSRPTTNSIMRSLSTEKFGPLNEKILISKLDVYGEDK